MELSRFDGTKGSFPEQEEKLERKMRRFALCAYIALIAVFAGVTESRAGFAVTPGDVIKLSNGTGSPGGIFAVDVLPYGAPPDFYTMCVELTEHVSFGVEYFVESVGLVTNQTGKTLQPKAAWLYGQASSGGLAGFDFATLATDGSTTARDKANALQLGIWLNTEWLESQVATTTNWNTNFSPTNNYLGSGLSYIAYLKATYLDPWLLGFDASWSGIATAQVMNLRLFKYVAPGTPGSIVTNSGDTILLKTGPSSYAQDQLFWTDPPGTGIVPELPTLYTSAALVAGALLGGVLTSRRKQRCSA